MYGRFDHSKSGQPIGIGGGIRFEKVKNRVLF